MWTICVAGLHIEITCADEAFFAPHLDKYACEPVTHPDMILCTKLLEKIDEPIGEPISVWGDTYLIKVKDRMCRYQKSAKGTVPLVVWYTLDYREVEIWIWRGFYTSDMTPTDWEYLHTGWCFANRLSLLGGTVLHSSAIHYQGKGLAFSADSGVGKSTHVSLWKSRFGNEIQILNDDKPALRFLDGELRIYGTPWSGKTNLSENVSCPLSAIFFIERAKENLVEKMEKTEVMYRMAKQLPTPFYDGKVTEKTLDFVARICEKHIPIYRLKCNISQEAVDVVYKEIYGGNLR